ncbi:MAG: UvrD-helicase domain-containing protein, partial [Oscillospiraceae bacterium]
MQDLKNEFNSLKKLVLEKKFGRMNDMQRQAVFNIEGPLLILAGAGSGKTTVLVNRIAYILNYGDAYKNVNNNDIKSDDVTFLQDYLDGKNCDEEKLSNLISCYPPNPWNLLAITFTNKAANELKERLSSLLGETATKINAGTFHSICVKILRREIEALGYQNNFTIYDTDDSVRVIKDCMTDLAISDKMFIPKQVLGEISRAKDSMLTPELFSEQNGSDFR